MIHNAVVIAYNSDKVFTRDGNKPPDSFFCPFFSSED